MILNVIRTIYHHASLKSEKFRVLDLSHSNRLSRKTVTIVWRFNALATDLIIDRNIVKFLSKYLHCDFFIIGQNWV